ncbi:MAG: anthranilate synthase component I, partial [Gluconacetobacter diazotrophicus]|nr:anthranilate synthase component I [Gluconacetobacter diazotrophicus]
MSGGGPANGDGGGTAAVRWRTEAADLLTPVAAFTRLRRHLPGADRQCFLLESVEGGVARGRYSVIGLLPDLQWRCRDGRAEQRRDGDGGFVAMAGSPLEGLRRLVGESRFALPPELPPMIGGVFGYLGY